MNPVTGETAIGPGGGVVTGSGGVEMRIPEGALAKGVAVHDRGPDAGGARGGKSGTRRCRTSPGRRSGSGIKIEAPTQPTFQKEVDLAFPVPAEALAATGGKPEDAFFYVYRRVETASGAVFFQNLDWAKVECPGGAASCADVGEEGGVVVVPVAGADGRGGEDDEWPWGWAPGAAPRRRGST